MLIGDENIRTKKKASHSRSRHRKRVWTIYPARPLTKVPAKINKKLNQEFPLLLAALRREKIKIYDFIGLDPEASPELVNEYDLACVSQSDLLLAIRPCPSDGVSAEIAWKCAKKEHVIVAIPKRCSISRMVRGWKAQNPNFELIEYKNLLDLVPVVIKHLENRKDKPKRPFIKLEDYRDPETREVLFRHASSPKAT